MKAQVIYEYLKSMDGGWVDWNNTVDSFKSGEPDCEVTGIAVGWMCYTWALKQALMMGCNLFIAHEPLYYNHRDNDESMFSFDNIKAKRKLIEDSNLTVLRCHDLWDQVKEIGIPDSWAQLLGFKHPVAGAGYYRVYDVSGHTGLSLAKYVANHVRLLGQEGVQLVGPPDADVTRVAIGTGAITPFTYFLSEYKVDAAICTDDGFIYWRDGALSIDTGIPVIVVNHIVSETYGVKLLANMLAGQFKDIPVHYIPQHCMFKFVAGDDEEYRFK